MGESNKVLYVQRNELSEKFKMELQLAVHGEAKYFNRYVRFFKSTDVNSLNDITYSIRCQLIDFLEHEALNEKLKGEYLSRFDAFKCEAIRQRYGMGHIIELNHSFFKDDLIYLPYYPAYEVANSFKQVVNKKELIWNLKHIKNSKLKNQIKLLLWDILNTFPVQTSRRLKLTPLKRLMEFCNKFNICDIETMEDYDTKRFYLYMANEEKQIRNLAGQIVEFCRRRLFILNGEINWSANVWYLERFSLDSTRKNASSPIVSLIFLTVQNKDNRLMMQDYMRYLIGVTDKSLAKIRFTYGVLREFLSFIESEGIVLNKVSHNSIKEYASYLELKKIKAITFNKDIAEVHRFIQFLIIKKRIVSKNFYREYFTKKSYPVHNDRSVPVKTIANILLVLYEFPKHLQLMYLILICTGLRKSEICTLKGDAFYAEADETWLRVYQPKMQTDKVIPIPSKLCDLMKCYISDHCIESTEYIFKNKKGNAYNGQTFSNRMIKGCEIHGIDCGNYIWRAHDYRHSVATYMYSIGVPLQAIRDFLDHRSEEMTKQYIDYVPEQVLKEQHEYNSKRKEGFLSKYMKGEQEYDK